MDPGPVKNQQRGRLACAPIFLGWSRVHFVYENVGSAATDVYFKPANHQLHWVFAKFRETQLGGDNGLPSDGYRKLSAVPGSYTRSTWPWLSRQTINPGHQTDSCALAVDKLSNARSELKRVLKSDRNGAIGAQSGGLWPQAYGSPMNQVISCLLDHEITLFYPIQMVKTVSGQVTLSETTHRMDLGLRATSNLSPSEPEVVQPQGPYAKAWKEGIGDSRWSPVDHSASTCTNDPSRSPPRLRESWASPPGDLARGSLVFLWAGVWGREARDLPCRKPWANPEIPQLEWTPGGTEFFQMPRVPCSISSTIRHLLPKAET